MTSELKKQLDALRAIAPRLDAVTDEANRVVAQVEKILVDELHVGVTASTLVATFEAGVDEDGAALERVEFLVFDRIGGRFRIGVSTVVRREDGEGPPISDELVAWPSCTRDQKLRGVADLPALVKHIQESALSLAEAAEKATQAIKEMVGDLPPPEPIAEQKKPLRPFRVNPSAAALRPPVFKND